MLLCLLLRQSTRVLHSNIILDSHYDYLAVICSQSFSIFLIALDFTNLLFLIFFFFFLNDPAPPEISPLPLHDPLPIWVKQQQLTAQVNPYINQATTPLSNKQSDVAVKLYDGALRLDPGNATATSARVGAITAKAMS